VCWRLPSWLSRVFGDYSIDDERKMNPSSVDNERLEVMGDEKRRVNKTIRQIYTNHPT